MLRPLFHKVVLAAGIFLGSQAAFAENRVALVIGQSNYRAVVALPNPANDARAVSKFLGDAGFEVLNAADLSQNEMREKISEFAARVAAKGPDTTALFFYAGHGLQVDGENFLIPVDVDPKREADIPLQAVRLNDVLNTLTSVPSKMRILLLDSCRNNPFPAINQSAGHGMAIVDTKTGVPGTFVSFSTSPGAEAEDGNGADSPYTSALLVTAKEPGLSIEDTFKRVRVSVNKATEGRQTPWDSSSLTDDFRFFPGQGVSSEHVLKLPVVKHSVDEWRRQLQGKPVEVANEMIVADGTDEAYEAFVGLFAQTPFGAQARLWLDRHRRMVAWNNAVIINTAAAYRAFLVQYPDSDLTATARKLEERLRNRPNLASLAAVVGPSGGGGPLPTNAALTCPCGPSLSPPLLKKVDLPVKDVPVKNDLSSKKHVKDTPKRGEDTPKRANGPRQNEVVDEVVVVRRPPPRYYDPSPGPSIGIGIDLGGGSFGGGGMDRGGMDRGGGGPNRRGGY